MNKKNYPSAVKVRPQLVLIGVVVIGIIIILILYNMLRSVNKIHHPNVTNENTANSLATAHDTAWYEKAAIVKNIPPPKVDNVVVVEPSVDSKTINATKQDKEIELPVMDEEMQKILSASIATNQIKMEYETNAEQPSIQSKLTPSQQTNSESRMAAKVDPNQQADKQNFVSQHAIADDIYLHSSVISPAARLELQAGTVIPGIMITGINSDLPGEIIGQVRENVYDTISGNRILIPQGAKLVGLYDSQVTYGQERVLIVWRRVLFPNGKSIDLEGMPGTDLSGLAGYSDKVNNHYLKMVKSVVLVSILSAGAQLSQPQQQFDNNSNGQLSVNQILAQSLGTNIASAGTQLFEKDMNIQPTLEIRPGYKFNIIITKDIVFEDAYSEG